MEVRRKRAFYRLFAAPGLVVMQSEMAVESLLELVEQSGVIAGDQMQQLVHEFRERRPPSDSAKEVADELVARGMLTRWQAEQLLHGKHRGFLLGPYRMLDLLGSGGMGRVYLAEHQMMHRRCAIKILPPKESKRQSSSVDRFYREAQAVAALDHPNIVRAYDVNKARIGETEVHYLVMEYVEGQDLQRMVERQGGLDYCQAADFICQAAEGLAHAHQRSLVHRDIKPANLIVDPQGVVKILDLGLACCFDDDADALAAAERGEGVLGTADYLAPEQAVNSQNVDARADIYSLGQTFYFLLTGHPPFPDGTVPERLFAHQKKSPQPIINTRPDAPPGLLAIIDKMTAKKPGIRYASAKQVAAAIEAWLAKHADGGSVRRSAPRVGKGVVAPPSADVSTDAVRSASGDTELELAPLEKDLVAALEENDLLSELLTSEPAPMPLGSQGPLSGPRLKTPAKGPALARLLELPAFWLSVAGLVIVVLIVGFVLSRPSTEEAQQQPSGDASQEMTPLISPPPLPLGPVEAPRPPPGPEESPREPRQGADPTAKPEVIVPAGSTWKWLHPTDGVDPATKDKDFHTTFFAEDYDDSHWRTGQDRAGPEGGFGYGDPVHVSFGTPAEGLRKTAYFRHRFKTRVAMKDLAISLQRDDGVIVYLDGKEVGRDNVGRGKEAYDLFARDTIHNDEETEVNRLKLSGSLPPGEHVLAISLHNRSDGSSDLRIAEISLHGVPATSSPH